MDELLPATADPQAEATAAPDTRSAMSGRRIGPYKMLREIGEGGFGTVYLAEQETPVQRTVALKIIKVGMDTHQVVARFEAERQALALMDHPHIARVIDAGATESGRPYFVMDFVKGEPITTYCDRNTLPLEARLALFVQVCEAVQHAHGKGVIHRDLKPSNILVASQDGVPSAKVIDFGIAKATARRLTDATFVTEQFSMVGTPEYMSPEQAEGSADIDTRTDVYSLGVVLYELLAGSTPFDLQALRQGGLLDIQRHIRETPPPRPSTRIGETGATLDAIAKSRQTDPTRLLQRVRGELDWITLKALEKDRARRYETANSLGLDVKRFLTGEAVLAVPPTTGYRVRTFVRRHTTGVAAAAVVALALLTATGVSLWFAREARLRAAAEATARSRAENLNRFITSVLVSANPQDGGRQQATVVDAMVGAARALERGELGSDPAVKAELLRTIGDVMDAQGLYDQAVTFATQGIALRRQVDGDAGSPALAEALDRLCRLQHGAGRFDDALASATEAVAMQKRVAPDNLSLAGTALVGLADAYAGKDRPEDAERAAQQAVDVLSRASGKNAVEDLAFAYQRLGMSRRQLRKFAEAEASYRQVLVLADKANQRVSQLSMSSLYIIGAVRFEQGELQRALGPFQESLALSRELYPGGHIQTMKPLSSLGTTYIGLHQPAEAERVLLESVAMGERLKVPERDLLGARQALGNVWLDVRRFDDAAAILEPILAYRKQDAQGSRIEIANASSNLARAMHGLGRTADERRLFADAHAITRSMLPTSAAAHSRLLWRSANARIEDGDLANGLRELEESVATAQAAFPAGNPRRVEIEKTLSDARARSRQALSSPRARTK